MVKHNNVLANVHCRKHWQERVKTHFNQPAKKKARRVARAARAAKLDPRPVDLLRPVVRCATLKYNRRVHLGRGFSIEELKAAGVNPKEARSIGIAVDHRRRNKSNESLETNVDRLKQFLYKLILFPRGQRLNAKKGDSAPEVTKSAQQVEGLIVMPIEEKKAIVETMEIAPLRDVKLGAYAQIRQARCNKRMIGIRKKKAAEEAAKAKKKPFGRK